MKIPVELRLAVLAVAATLFYTWVGQKVPQKEVYPPEVVEIATDVSTAEMVEIGQEIFNGKGICITCHNGSARFPDLDGIATRAASRVPGMNDVQYFAQSLYEPDAYLVPGFNPGMPVADKPPIGLTDDEIKTVIAYLQSLGGTPTITMDMDPRSGGSGEAVADAAPAADAQVADAQGAAAPADGSVAVLASYGCARCHGDAAEGPTFTGIGDRLDRGQIVNAIINHGPARDELSGVTLADVQEMADVLVEQRDQG
ncbi:MAG: cytochrome c [Acidobacteriota bacterium]